ncbi:MAG: hypothetical protein OXC07_03480 [Kistimonas sp.]|nr:hypothetical protein [Kistimonas sp.]
MLIDVTGPLICDKYVPGAPPRHANPKKPTRIEAVHRRVPSPDGLPGPGRRPLASETASTLKDSSMKGTTMTDSSMTDAP